MEGDDKSGAHVADGNEDEANCIGIETEGCDDDNDDDCGGGDGGDAATAGEENGVDDEGSEKVTCADGCAW